MQQTQTYKLNKPGTDDPIAIAPLNENMEKIEAALTTEAQARTEADAAEAQARQAAVNSEAQTRAAAVASEAQARANADAAEIQARQAAVDSEAQTRAAADAAEIQARQAAVNSEAQARASADNSEAQTRAAAVAALDSRVAALEAHKIVVGTYHGNGRTRSSTDRTVVSQTIQLGFTPTAVIVHREGTAPAYFFTAGHPLISNTEYVIFSLNANGFDLEDGYGNFTLNGPYDYHYIAIG